MTDPTPLTDDEWRSIVPRLTGHPETASVACTGLLLARLAVTVDALRAERDAARADRVCWRETHNQVAAERDALAARAEQAEADVLLNHRCHTAAIERWHETCDAVLHAVIEYGTLRSVVEVVAEWLDGSDALDDEVCDLIRRALDASPTEGNPE